MGRSAVASHRGGRFRREGTVREAGAGRAVSRTMRTSSRRAPLVVLAACVAALGSGCGGDAPETKPAPARGSPTDAGPLARWRRASEPGPFVKPVLIEALRDCRVRTSFL